MFRMRRSIPLAPPEYFPPYCREAWGALANPAAIRREAASLLLADMRVTGPSWPTERFECLRCLLKDLVDE